MTDRLVSRWPKGTVRWTSPQNFHLTLRFLGDTREEQIPGICELVDTCYADLEPIPLALCGIAGFPHTAQPRVIWVGVRDDTFALRRFFSQLKRGVRALG